MPSGDRKILVVDEDEQVCAQLSEYLAQEGFVPLVTHSGQEALEKVRSEHPNALIVALRLPGLDGMQTLKEVRALDEDLPVIMITGYPDVRGAVTAIRAGAHDYLAKPLRRQEVLRVVFRALNESALPRRSRRVSCQVEDEASLAATMGPSEAISHLIAEVARVAKTNFSVLILGETGSGKEVVANTIHQLSVQSKGPFLAVDCGAIPETLLESELFGHERGAYTGADRQKIGKIELARGGTLFLDEISNLPLGSQGKLLRVLQDKAIHRVGGLQPVHADVRVLAASNQDLRRLGESGGFRSDLYFRLNEFSIRVPPLRERREDILYLAKRFLDVTNLELEKRVSGFSPSAVEALLAYDWPGNVRQLRSMIRRAVLLADDVISERHMGLDCIVPRPPLQRPRTEREATDPSQDALPLKEIRHRKIIALEREILTHVLLETGGNKAKAARLLQIDYKTIHSKIRKYGISINGRG